ncbi:MAG: hypothetical protein ISP86_01290 [Shewanellaceae bacterium]|nr:hypothetical protein [Shewanellaceae bacterium]
MNSNYRILSAGLILVCSYTSCANTLEQKLILQANDFAKWQRRNQELVWVENYMLRNTVLDPSITTWVKASFQDNIIPQVNYFLQASPNKRIFFSDAYMADMRMFQRTMDSILHGLPPLEVDTYTSIILPKESWESLAIDDIFRHSGYLHTDATLMQTSLKMENDAFPLPSNYEKILIKVRSKRSRPAMTLMEAENAQFIQPRNSHFRIVSKGVHPSDGIKLLEWQEVVPQMLPDGIPIQTLLDEQLYTMEPKNTCFRP